MDQSVIPECYVDTNLIETLVPPQKQYNHQKGCGTVMKVMKEKFADSFALGIIDKDKTEVEYLKEFNVLVDKGSLILHKHPSRNHFIIQINPAIEKFILNNASLAGINIEDYYLPSDFDRLKKASKTINSKNDDRFKRLFKAIQKKDVSDFKLLTSWVKYLRDNGYNINVEYLKGL